MDKITEIRRLWRERFNDSRNWMTNVFPRIYRDEEAIVLPADGGNSLASMLLLRRYTMRYRGTDIPVGYIYGAATSRELQGKGYMSRLMPMALREAYTRGDLAVALQPARRRLYGFYEQFGFSTTFYIREQRYTAKHRFAHNESRYITEYSGHDAAELTAAFSRLTAGRESTILHTEEDFKTIMIDCELDEGCIVTVRSVDRGDIVGLAYGVASADSIAVREIAALDEDAEAAVLDALSTRYPGKMTVVEAYPGETNAIKIFSRGMARIVNVKAFLELLAALSPKLRQRIRVSDPLIEENNAIFAVRDGKVTATPYSREERVDLEVTIPTLTSILFSASNVGEIFSLPTARPFMSRMLS